MQNIILKEISTLRIKQYYLFFFFAALPADQKINLVSPAWYRCDKCGLMDKNVECMCSHKVEAVEYFELLDMRYGDMNAITQRV